MRPSSLFNLTLALSFPNLSFIDPTLDPVSLFASQGHFTEPAMAATARLETNGWHPGELKAHSLLHVPTSGRRNPSAAGLPGQYAARIAASGILAVGTLDSAGHVWTTLWGGERGCAGMVATGVVAVRSLVSFADPVLEGLLNGQGEEGVVKPREGERNVLSALAIDLETRDRVKLAGRMVVAAVVDRQEGREVQMGFAVEESLGNCPKYLNRKRVRAHLPRRAGKEGEDRGLKGWGAEARRVVESADMFFMSTTEGGRSMDTNHRGGARGFMRILEDKEGVVLVYPEFSGNQLYQSLGNLHVDGRIGVVVPDFETGNVLFVTGRAEVLVGEAAATVMPHSRVAVKITVAEARFVKDGLPFRGEAGDPSPYNPPVRRLASEGQMAVSASESPAATALLLLRETITPTVGRFTFRLKPEKDKTFRVWKAGHYITLDFSSELDHGYSHMRDDDPQSLNDDYIRTFTISSPPPTADSDGYVKNGTEMQITTRRHGPATNLLWRQPLQVPLYIPVLGFGGGDGFDTASAREEKAIFIAGGVGITPLLAQAPSVFASGQRLALLWSLRADDLPLAIDSFDRITGLAGASKLFVTSGTNSLGETEWIKKLKEMGATVMLGRLTREEVLGAKDGEGKNRFFVCTSPEMQSVLQEWLDGETLVVESFAY